ncbi:MAG: hypothetical protein JWQ98_1799 [Chlorobi bacterium]|nr:hypothetical protein [Chlorobiota bacterium]
MKTFAMLFVMLALSALLPPTASSAGNGASGTGASAVKRTSKKKIAAKKTTAGKAVAGKTAVKRTASIRTVKTTSAVQPSMKSVVRRHGGDAVSMQSRVRRVVASAPEVSMESKVRRGTGGAVTGGRKQ